MRGCFVTGTDTGVGKTVLAAAICATLAARGTPVVAYKPVLSGLDDPPPHDHDVLAACTGQAPDAVAPRRFREPVSPHLAARWAGASFTLDELVADAPSGAPLIVEGAGGLLVPLAAPRTMRELAAAFGLPLVVAARPGLGTINHTLLTLESARAAGLEVRGVVLTPWPGEPSPMEEDNRACITELGAVDVAVLPRTALDPAALVEAAAGLPVDAWVA